jgi:RNA polymerase sigma factor (sigma-70 family)
LNQREFIPHDELDALLEAIAIPPESFEERAVEILDRLDAEDTDLEIRDPQEYRRGKVGRRASTAEQFRADVDTILLMDRESEACLARRIVLARMRFERARQEAGLEGEGTLQDMLAGPLPPRVRRHAMELHAMRSEMVERNLYLVLINVERYAQPGSSRLDLIQEGCASLFRAVDGFDWKRGLLFRTYAVHWLNQAFRNYLYNNGHTVRVPVYLQKALKHINQASIKLGKENPSAEELAESSKLNVNLIRSALAAARRNYSIDADFSEGQDGSRLRDLLVDESSANVYDPRLEDIALEDGLERALGSLLDREEFVLRMRFGLGYEREHTLAEVAARLGVSVERVRQIQVRALSKLATPTLRRELDPYLN